MSIMRPMGVAWLGACLAMAALGAVAGESQAGEPKAPDALPRGLVAHYFRDPEFWNGIWPDGVSQPDGSPGDWTFSTYEYSRVEPLVNHRFIRHGWFSVRWVGYLDTTVGASGDEKGSPANDGPESADYTFEIWADDGCRLFIDGKPVIDSWKACWEDSPDARRVGMPVRLTNGLHRVVIEYFQGQSLKRKDSDPIRVYWTCSDRKIPRQIVPAAHWCHGESDLQSADR